MEIVGAIVLIIIAVAFVALVLGTLRTMRKIGQASEDLSCLLKNYSELSQDVHVILNDTDKLITGITETAERVDNIAEGAERLLNTAQVASTAIKSIRLSSAGLISVLEGVKQGIKTLRDPHTGGASNE